MESKLRAAAAADDKLLAAAAAVEPAVRPVYDLLLPMSPTVSLYMTDAPEMFGARSV